MKNIVLPYALAVVLTGCGDRSATKPAVEDAVKAAVQAQLKGPNSAQFKQVIISKEGSLACIEYNAKNSYGDYGNPSFAQLQKIDTGWTVMTMEQKQYRCTAEGLQVQEAGDTAEVTSQRQAIAQLKALNKIPSSEEGFDGPCGKLVWLVGFNAKLLAREKIEKSSTELHVKELENALEKALAGC